MTSRNATGKCTSALRELAARSSGMYENHSTGSAIAMNDAENCTGSPGNSEQNFNEKTSIKRVHVILFLLNEFISRQFNFNNH